MNEKLQVRLECLKLAHRHDRPTAEVVKMAGDYEAFVVGSPVEVKETPPPSTTASTLLDDTPATPAKPPGAYGGKQGKRN